MYNEKTGKYDGISSVYRIKMASAYVVDPDKPMDIPKLAGDEERMQAFLAIKANTIKGAETRIPQAVPPGTTRGGAGLVRARHRRSAQQGVFHQDAGPAALCQ